MSSLPATPMPYWSDDACTLYLGDCRAVLADLPEASVDAVVTDPPYEYAFMGRQWDSTGVAFDPATWAACLRVLKPGGHLLAFGAPRTYHRMVCAIEDAGLEIRDSLHWVYGSGFPKSLDVGKAIDKAAGVEREILQTIPDRWAGKGDVLQRATQAEQAEVHITAPATDEARQWDGWGTATKPGHEPIVLARKPFAGTVASNVLAYGTGALNIDGCRVGTVSSGPGTTPQSTVNGQRSSMAGPMDRIAYDGSAGRWPTNIVFSHSASCVEGQACEADCPVGELDRQSGTTKSSSGPVTHGGRLNGGRYGSDNTNAERYEGAGVRHGDSGGASRFFPTFRYQAKAPASERPKVNGVAHPTVKPVNLLRFLTKLVTPPGGVVLDMFAGSGSTLEAALLEGFQAIGIEAEPDYMPLIMARLSKATQAALTLD